jgi:hypothetical protein
MPIPKLPYNFNFNIYLFIINPIYLKFLMYFLPVARKVTTDFVVILYGNFHKFALYHSHFPGILKANSEVDPFFRSNASHQTSASKMETDTPHRHTHTHIHIHIYIYIYMCRYTTLLKAI